MAARTFIFMGSLIFVMALFPACTPKSSQPAVHLLVGKCQVDVSTPFADATVLVDGIHVGDGSVSITAPCGEKKISVTKEGYVPQVIYKVVSEGSPLLLAVELKKFESTGNYALSAELVNQVRTAQLAKGAIEGGHSVPAPSAGSEAAVEEEINWDDWS